MKRISGFKWLLTALLVVPLATACGAGVSGTAGSPAANASAEGAAPSPVASTGPSAPGTAASANPSGQSGHTAGTLEISFPYVRQDGIATNQFAVWVEDSEGHFIKTVFATHFIATGGFKVRPEAIPTWVERSGLAQASAEEADAVSGATPSTGDQKFVWDCKDQKGNAVPAGDYRFYVEGTTRWENRILYEGTIAIGGETQATAEAAVKESTDDAKQSGMIGQVTAVYTP